MFALVHAANPFALKSAIGEQGTAASLTPVASKLASVQRLFLLAVPEFIAANMRAFCPLVNIFAQVE